MHRKLTNDACTPGPAKQPHSNSHSAAINFRVKCEYQWLVLRYNHAYARTGGIILLFSRILRFQNRLVMLTSHDHG